MDVKDGRGPKMNTGSMWWQFCCARENVSKMYPVLVVRNVYALFLLFHATPVKLTKKSVLCYCNSEW
jgi:hypothetical protein